MYILYRHTHKCTCTHIYKVFDKIEYVCAYRYAHIYKPMYARVSVNFVGKTEQIFLTKANNSESIKCLFDDHKHFVEMVIIVLFYRYHISGVSQDIVRE